VPGEDLDRRFLAGDAGAVATVSGWVRQAAAPFRRRLAFELEDVVQQALVELTADLRAGRFRGAGTFQGYVWRSVNHTCLDRLRHQRRWRWAPIEDHEPEDTSPSPFAATARRQTSRRILAIIAGLPSHCRELWAMILDGMSYREMATRVEVAEGTLRVRALRCRQQAVARWQELVTNTGPDRQNVSEQAGEENVRR
jgi:RNA polymerase sigma-70 factor (ECF subfamily)